MADELSPGRVGLRVRLLGPVAVSGPGGTTRFAGSKQRALLARLAVEPRRLVTTEQLVDAVWGDRSPPTVRASIHVHISQIRRALADVGVSGALLTRQPGYVLDVPFEAVDLTEFWTACEASREAVNQLRSSDVMRHAEEIRSMLSERPLSDIGDVPFRTPLLERIDRSWCDVLLDAANAAGRTGNAEAWSTHIDAVADAHPYDERLALAAANLHYALGRSKDALARLRQIRLALSADLGLDPSPAVAELELAVLNHDLPSAARARARIGHVPAPARPCIGREAELETLRAVMDGGARLVSLTGAGGVGKTRLANELARRLEGTGAPAVHWIELAALSSATEVLAVVAEVVGCSVGLGPDGIADRIGDRELIVFLDTMEHVLAASPTLGTLVERCPKLTIVVTSRVRMQLPGETIVRVPPLDPGRAVELFCARTQLDPTADVEELCARLDNLPLAIELAAGMSHVLTPRQILDDLDGPVTLRTSSGPPRHRSLAATLDWTLDQLDDDARDLFAELAVFRDGWDLEAARGICGADIDGLQQLVELGLVTFRDGRFGFLDTVRVAANQRANATNRDNAAPADRHARHYADLALTLRGRLRRRDPLAAIVVRREAQNMLAGLRWACRRGDTTTAADLMASLWFWLLTHSSRADAAGIARDYLAIREGDPGGDASYEAGDDGASELLRFGGDSEAALDIKQRLVDRWSRMREPGVADQNKLAAALSDMAWIELCRDDVEGARRRAAEALAIRKRFSNSAGIGHAVEALAGVAVADGDLTRAVDLYDRAAVLAAEDGDSDVVHAETMAALCEAWAGRPEDASARLRRSVETLVDFDDRYLDGDAIWVAMTIASARPDPNVVARLHGARTCCRGTDSMSDLPARERERYAATVGAARRFLGARFDPLVREGTAGSRAEVYQWIHDAIGPGDTRFRLIRPPGDDVPEAETPAAS